MNKSSYIQWLGNIPDGWEVVSVKKFLKISDRRKGDDNLQLLSVYREYGVIPKDSRDDNHNVESSDLSNYKYVGKGYLVMNKMKMWQGSLGVSDYEGIVSPAYIVCEIIKNDFLDNKFLNYLLRCDLIKPFYNSISYGIRVGQWDLKYDDFKKLSLPLPPLSVQRRISSYLDEKTELINRLIETRTAQIDKLKQYRAAVVSSAVTKGLNPNRKMKNSNIQWIGDIPEDWKVVRFANICETKSIIDCCDEELLSVYLDKGVIRFSDDNNKRTNPTSKDLSKYQLVEYGDFVLNNQQAWRGSVGVSKFRGIISPAYFVFKISSKIDSEFANLMFRSKPYVTYYEICSKGVGSIQRNLDWEQLKQKYIYIPPLSEQRSIVSYLDKKVSEINNLIKTYEDEIEKMKNYKNSLVSAVVTGQIAV